MTPFSTSLPSMFNVGRSMFNVLLLFLFLLTVSAAQAQPNRDKQDSEIVIVTGNGSGGVSFLRWFGHIDRSYFVKVADHNNPLGKWNWAPVIEAGNNAPISHEIGGLVGKSFFRLRYTGLLPGPGETLDTADFDKDGLSNLDEIAPPPPLLASDATDPLDPDTDHDGLTDGYERDNGLDPNDDGSTNPDNGPNGDPDGDGLVNLREQTLGSNPRSSDSDLDGATDLEEAASGHDPASAQSHPPIWIRTQRRSFHGLPYIQSSMDWNLAGTVHHGGFPTVSAPGTCAAFLAGDCPFPAQPLAPGHSPYYGYNVGLIASTGYRPHPGYNTHLVQTRFWRKTLPAPAADVKTKLLKITRRFVRGPDYSEVVLDPVTEIIEVIIPSGESTSDPIDVLPDFTEIIGDKEFETVEIDLIPVEFKTYPDTEPGPNKAHKRNLKHLPPYDVHYSSDWKKCVCKVWDTSGEINLIDYLEGGVENRALYENTVKWKVNGTVQESHELSFGGEPADDEQQHFFVEVLPKTGDSATIDRLIVNVVPRTTKTKFDNWYSANLADMGWLNHLPAIYSQLGAGNSDPEPFVWGINFWIAPTSLSGSFYHPESSFDLRSEVVESFDETYAGCGHQATYDSTGGLIRADKGVSAGSADRVASIPAGGAYTGYTHVVADVTPFVWASQLDGNPCSATSPLPTNLTHPMLHEGVFLKKYLQVRPTIANGKPELLPSAQ